MQAQGVDVVRRLHLDTASCRLHRGVLAAATISINISAFAYEQSNTPDSLATSGKPLRKGESGDSTFGSYLYPTAPAQLQSQPLHHKTTANPWKTSPGFSSLIIRRWPRTTISQNARVARYLSLCACKNRTMANEKETHASHHHSPSASASSCVSLKLSSLKMPLLSSTSWSSQSSSSSSSLGLSSPPTFMARSRSWSLASLAAFSRSSV